MMRYIAARPSAASSCLTRIAVAMSFGALLACSAPRPSLDSRYVLLSQQPTDARPTLGYVMLVADNQVHHLFGEPTFFRTRFTDTAFSETAIRPPQLDIFGQDWFKAALERESRRSQAVIHLGDALDFACDAEWTQFKSVMAAASVPWVMAPGNHDAYFFGNFEVSTLTTSRGAQIPRTTVAKLWEASCRNGGAPLRKDRFVLGYLKVLREQLLTQRLDAFEYDDGSWSCAGQDCSRSFLQRARWSVDRKRPWRSFVVQLVNLAYLHQRQPVSLGAGGARAQPEVPALPPFYAIVLDTSVYVEPPGLRLESLKRAAGKLGVLGSKQTAIVRSWLETPELQQRPPVPMGHHPFEELDEAAQELISKTVMSGGQLYVSAHTHRGGYFVHGSGEQGWLELNLGSVLDWPPHYALFTLLTSEQYDRRLVLRAVRKRMQDVLSDGVCQPVWEPQPGDADFFVSYATLSGKAAFDADAIQERVLEVLAAAMERFFRCVPEAGQALEPGKCAQSSKYDARIAEARSMKKLRDKTKAVQALIERASEAQSFVPELWANYRLCQAYWAAKYERFEARVPAEFDEYFVLPHPAATGGTP